MESKKSTFIMYPTDFLAAVHNFTKRETGELIIALCEYNLYEKISLKISNDVKDKFNVLQKIIDDNNAKYLEICEKRKNNAKQKASKPRAKVQQTDSKTSAKLLTDSPTENESEKENESVNVLDNGSRERELQSVDNSEFVGAPTVKDVADYCSELGIPVDVMAFMAWHNERGWRYGKKYIALDWKTAVRKWYCKDAGISLADFEAGLTAGQNELGKGKVVQNV
ncbi:MAG: hypothetical protein IJ677_02585 [Alphaproteobacteria bacterium]|nr:hypothetical protein [Alphaproteobacteria bacterium]